jgi:hypothetical protein
MFFYLTFKSWWVGFGWVAWGSLDEFRRGWAELARDVDNVFCFALLCFLTSSSLVKRKSLQ